MGAVYRATHLKLGRQVAIKVLLEQFGSQASFLVRFEREAKALASLGHPNIVSITDYGVSGDLPFLVMELLEGETLAARLKRAPFPPGQVLEIATQMLRALSFVHERGLVHRDLKPGNVFLQRLPGGGEQLKLLDFGLAKYTHTDPSWAEQSLTNAGEIVGTPSYISPEQIACEPTDARTDVYSMGVMLFEMLSGRLPFEGRPADQLKMHLAAPVPPLAHVCSNHGVSPALEALLQRAMAKQREQRFGDAAAMLQALEHLPQPWLWVDESNSSGISPAGTINSPVPIEIGRRVAQSLQPLHQRRSGLLLAVLGLCAAVAAAVLVLDRSARQASEGSLHAASHAAQEHAPAAQPSVPAAPAAPGTELEPAPEADVTAEAAGASAEEEPALAEEATPSAASAPGDEAAVLHDEPPKPAPTPKIEPKRQPARNPWLRNTPRELRTIRSAVNAGATGNDRTILALRAHTRANPDDPRARLLLAKLYLNRNWRADALSQYTIAYRTDPTARGATPMLSDLIDLSARGPVTSEAARLIREAYGSEAIAAIDQAINTRKKEPESVNRLKALRARIH